MKGSDAIKLEDLKPQATISGILPDSLVTVVTVTWFGSDAVELAYKDPAGKIHSELLYRSDESRLEIAQSGRPWSFDGDGHTFRLVSEAHRIRLAHLFDPVLAVHTSMVEPLPHQITAVYEEMLPRQPLRFLLADDPGAGKTIMAGLFIKELMTRGDLKRCLVVCPGSLAEQWQDELYQRFNLPFSILTNENLESARTGNWFVENPLVIARLDKLSRNEDVQDKLADPDATWDLIICDEAHKMSATFFGGEIKYTKRYRLGQLLGRLCRHFLLMTATPHNGKEEDFQLFMALLDGDRFEGRFRDGVHTADVSDMMRRMVKENLLTFEAKPLFPERIAKTVSYKLSQMEADLYAAVTHYVRDEFNRAEKLQNDRRTGTVGFALTILQRRLASSPEAIYQSLRRRRVRLEATLREVQLMHRGASGITETFGSWEGLDPEDMEDLEDAPGNEIEESEGEFLDKATAAQTITELQSEIRILTRLEELAQRVRHGGEDKKWTELATLLSEIFTPAILASTSGESTSIYGIQPVEPEKSINQKLVIFTEQRDTLNYLYERITTLLGRQQAVVCIHGAMTRSDRLKAQEAFKHDPEVKVLIATDAAGEGINLQRAHLMVNYDLPWNPNRLEQRFGRIHRIGQKEVCHLWNLLAEDTREGEVYRALLEKLEEARKALGGQVFDVLGKMVFDGRPLKDLLVEAVRYGENPEVRARLNRSVAGALDRSKLTDLLEDKALVRDTMDTSKVHRIRQEMERAEARRLQPFYIQSFFLEAFKKLGGTLSERETGRFEVTHVPAVIRSRDRLIGLRDPVLSRYERIAFDKSNVSGPPLAAFICPGHPLLDSTLDLTLERHRDLLRRGAVLVDERDPGTEPRVLFYLEHAIQDAIPLRSGERRVISKQMIYVEMNAAGEASHIHYAPYLDYRPLSPDEPTIDELLAQPQCAWITPGLEQQAQNYAIAHVVPEHLKEVRETRLPLITKVEAAVKERLTKEISYWDHRAQVLKLQEQAAKPNARLNSNEALKRADALQARLQARMDELKQEAQLSPLPPVVVGGLLIVPLGLVSALSNQIPERPTSCPVDTQESAARAREIVMEAERKLGYDPVDREFEKLGYDIESCCPRSGKLRFIEVKGRVSGADCITVTRNEILYCLNKPEDYILAVVEYLSDTEHRLHYINQPFREDIEFHTTSMDCNLQALLKQAYNPLSC